MVAGTGQKLERQRWRLSRQGSVTASLTVLLDRAVEAARRLPADKATSKNGRTGSELRHPRESGDPGGLGPRFRGDDVGCCLNAK